MILLTMTILMYTGIIVLIKSDHTHTNDYEKRQILKQHKLVY